MNTSKSKKLKRNKLRVSRSFAGFNDGFAEFDYAGQVRESFHGVRFMVDGLTGAVLY